MRKGFLVALSLVLLAAQPAWGQASRNANPDSPGPAKVGGNVVVRGADPVTGDIPVDLGLSLRDPASKRGARDEAGGSEIDGVRACWGNVTEGPVDEEVDVTRKLTTMVKGKPVVTEVYDHTDRKYTFMCNGAVFKVVTKCVRGNCPPPPPPSRPRNWNLVVRQLTTVSSVVKLPPPSMQFVPKPIRDAPIVGLPFFYGVSKEQFDGMIQRRLVFCFDEECGSLNFSAIPRAVVVDPIDRLSRTDVGVRSSCRRPIPEIRSGEDAARADRDCALVFENSGSFDLDFGLLYDVGWTLNRWAFTVAPPVSSDRMELTAWTRQTILVHQVQPVLTYGK